MPTFAGIDSGAIHHQVAVVDDAGVEMFNKRHAHTRDGVDALIDRLVELPDLVGVAIERSDGIIVDRLHAAGLVVFPVSPRVCARARERQQAAVRKNDRFDAFVLADTLRTDGWRWRPLRPSSALHAELHPRGLGRVRLAHIDTSQRKAEIHDFIEANVEPGTILYTDGESSYNDLPARLGITHERIVMVTSKIVVRTRRRMQRPNMP